MVHLFAQEVQRRVVDRRVLTVGIADRREPGQIPLQFGQIGLDVVGERVQKGELLRLDVVHSLMQKREHRPLELDTVIFGRLSLFFLHHDTGMLTLLPGNTKI